MQDPGKTPVPNCSKALALPLDPVYRLFDWLFTSRYNPLYRSGTLAVGFLFVLLVTGLYLAIFYSVSEPYQSVAAIDAQPWLGRWIRALHRYSTAAALIAVGFHVLQLLSQGKTWGPRTLAWLVGVVLSLMLLVSAWTGYVMVWDLHGQLVAISGASLLGGIPFLHDAASLAFNGMSPISPGFFFMNLFLHVAVPVLMIFFLWIHTSRLSRAVWFPSRTILISSIGALTLLSCVITPPLLQQADLSLLVGRVPIDLLANSWILFLHRFGVGAAWVVLLIPPVLLLSIPLWWRPKPGAARQKSRVDTEHCTGCTQCALDCPYEAISMAPRADGRRLVAVVNSGYCVSCGICSASCTEYAVGPPQRTAREQMLRFEEAFQAKDSGLETSELIIAACTNNESLCTTLAQYAAENDGCRFLSVECCGCLHSDSLKLMLEHAQGVALIGCPARNCFNRDGLDLLSERIYEKRVPFLDREIDRGRVLVAAHSGVESTRVRAALTDFRGSLSERRPASITPITAGQRLRIVLGSIFLLGLVALVSQYPVGAELDYGILRIAGILPSSIEGNCRQLSESELAKIPFHMRQKQVCEAWTVTYLIELSVDGEVVGKDLLSSQNRRTDRPLLLNLDFKITPGKHKLRVRLERRTTGAQPEIKECSAAIEIAASGIHLVRYLRDEGALVCS